MSHPDAHLAPYGPSAVHALLFALKLTQLALSSAIRARGTLFLRDRRTSFAVYFTSTSGRTPVTSKARVVYIIEVPGSRKQCEHGLQRRSRRSCPTRTSPLSAPRTGSDSIERPLGGHGEERGARTADCPNSDTERERRRTYEDGGATRSGIRMVQDHQDGDGVEIFGVGYSRVERVVGRFYSSILLYFYCRLAHYSFVTSSLSLGAFMGKVFVNF